MCVCGVCGCVVVYLAFSKKQDGAFVGGPLLKHTHTHTQW